jgi:hypothetical protein
MDMCCRCKFFREHYGENQGECYGMPPPIFQSGVTPPKPPLVKKGRLACSLFVSLPEGVEAPVKTKVDPETVGDAAKQARQLADQNRKNPLQPQRKVR